MLPPSKSSFAWKFFIICVLAGFYSFIEYPYMYDYSIIHEFFQTDQSYASNRSYFYLPSFRVFQFLYWHKITFVLLMVIILAINIILLDRLCIARYQKFLLYIIMTAGFCLDVNRGNNNMLLFLVGLGFTVGFDSFLVRTRSFFPHVISPHLGSFPPSPSFHQMSPLFSSSFRSLSSFSDPSSRRCMISSTNPLLSLWFNMTVGVVGALVWYKVNFLLFLGVCFWLLFRYFRLSHSLLALAIFGLTAVLLNVPLLVNVSLRELYFYNLSWEPVGRRLNIFFQLNQLGWMYLAVVLFCRYGLPRLSARSSAIMEICFFFTVFTVKIVGIWIDPSHSLF